MSIGKNLSQLWLNYIPDQNTLQLFGDWSCRLISEIMIDSFLLSTFDDKSNQTIIIDAIDIKNFDTTGALFLNKIVKFLQKKSISVSEFNLKPRDQDIYDLIVSHLVVVDLESNQKSFLFKLTHRIGVGVGSFVKNYLVFLSFFGQLAQELFLLIVKPARIEPKFILDNVLEVSIKGFWIICLLCFLIGVNLSYQMSQQFVVYGANIYVVNFLGISLFKEIAPLLTALIVAGRSGSAIAASIGTMKVQEEVEALQIMGISPFKRLVLPQVLGMMISVPILTIFADLASMFGGMLIAKFYLGISFELFLHRAYTDVSIYNYTDGIIKSVAFAIVIGLVACFCGFNVRGSAESVGRETTKSVVLSIFLIVFVDAIFGVLFTRLGV